LVPPYPQLWVEGGGLGYPHPLSCFSLPPSLTTCFSLVPIKHHHCGGGGGVGTNRTPHSATRSSCVMITTGRHPPPSPGDLELLGPKAGALVRHPHPLPLQQHPEPGGTVGGGGLRPTVCVGVRDRCVSHPRGGGSVINETPQNKRWAGSQKKGSRNFCTFPLFFQLPAHAKMFLGHERAPKRRSSVVVAKEPIPTHPHTSLSFRHRKTSSFFGAHFTAPHMNVFFS